MKKAAVVIGVDKTGKLMPLKSAATGAQRVAEWLETEGFKVKCLTDKNGPVTCDDVEKAIETFVTLPARYHLLLVYFSGHGYWQARSDTWLLSGAPVKPDEAINLAAAADLAKYSGVKNVVFVSDACRSIPDSRSGGRVDGRGVFPNYDEITTASKIDYFKATSEARPAYEGVVGGVAKSVLTAALMSAYKEPDAHMVRQITEGQETIEVVPNRRLEDYLQTKVDRLLAIINPTIRQQIEINVPSSDDVYIARVHRPSARASTPTPPAPAPTPPAPPNQGREAAVAIARSLSTRPFGGGGADDTLGARDPTIESKLRKRLPDANVVHFESEMGFVIHGATVIRAVASQGRSNLLADVLDSGDANSRPGLVRVSSEETFVVRREDVASIGVQLGDGRGVVLAGLPGYIGHVGFKQEGMANVSYVPSGQHWRFGEYQQRRDEIDRLRAMVALAVDRHTFRLNSEQEANALADRIRISKRVDPTLGLYAAYAFSQASNEAQLLSVLHYMRGDLATDLFDVRLLANRNPSVRDERILVTPFCPMLTQSWNLLRPRRVELPAILRDARASLCGSLWTTFKPGAAKAILDAMEKGELQ